MEIQNTKQTLKNFPNVKLNYGKVSRTKPTCDYCIVVPYGKKAYAWFTLYKNDCVCMIINDKKDRIYVYPCIFDISLCGGDGTIFYGTFTQNMFYLEDVCYYKDKYTCSEKNDFKLKCAADFFTKNYKQHKFFKNSFTIVSPLILEKFDEEKINNCGYKVFSVQFKKFTHPLTTIYLMKETRVNKCNFLIKPTPQFDVYELYCYDNKKMKFYANALIPDFKTSKMMNNLFRNIKENNNLDSLEESDEEDEFENISEDKYIITEKMVIECVYNNRFKKWVPKNKQLCGSVGLKNDIKRMEI